ncbi:hypothetical protein [Amorphus sp. MBR-141]
MSSRMNFDDAEIASHTDFTGVGLFAQGAIDDLVADAIGYPNHWAAFTVAKASAQEVTISPGRYVAGREVYAQEEALTLNLQLHIPIATSDQRWVAILLRGEEVTENENRPFQTSEDPENSVVVMRPTPKRIRRRVTVVVQAGEINPVPVKPAVAETDACIAYVLLKATGIPDDGGIEPGASTRVKTLYEVEGRLTTLEVDLDALFLRTAVIETQITNLNDKVTEIPRRETIRQMQRDIGAARLLLDLPDEMRSYVYDNGLVPDRWDTGHGSWLARVSEGIRYGFSQTNTGQLVPTAPSSADIMWTGERMMPAFDQVARIANGSIDTTIAISQLAHTEVEAIMKTVPRIRVTYGPTVQVCENTAGWAALADAQIGTMLRHDGEEFEVVEYYGDWEGLPDHSLYGIRQIRREVIEEAYWEYKTVAVGVNGSIFSQTFLVAQPMIATSLSLYFSRVAADGDVHLLLVETTPSAAPQVDKVIATATLAHGTIVQGWNNIPLALTMLEAGKRYAWVTVTTGAHSLGVSTGNKFANGTLFRLTDGAFAQGDLEQDFAFILYAARFRSPRTVVPFNPVVLTDGMTELDLLHSGWEPGGTKLQWEIKPAGQSEWRVLEDGNPAANALVGLPASTEIRLVMVGTQDLAPMIQVDAWCRWTASRNRGDMKAISEEFAFGLSTTTIQTLYTVDAFDPAHHTFVPKIMVAGVEVDPDTTEIRIDPDRPERRRYLSTYTVASTAAARMVFQSTTDNPVIVPFVQDAFIAAL